MSLPNIHRKLFQSEGAAAMLREDILPDHDFSYLGKAVHGSHICSDNLPEGSEVSTGGAGYDMGSGGLMVFYQGLKLILGEQYEEVESGEAVIINFAAEEGAVFDFESHGGWEYEVPKEPVTFKYTVAPESTSSRSYCPLDPSRLASGTSIDIDWGDGTTDVLEAGESTDTPTHAYSTSDGTRYQIAMSATADVWAGVTNIFFGSSTTVRLSANDGEPEPYAENTNARVRYLTSVDTPLPALGIETASYMFYYNGLLETLCDGLFKNVTGVSSFYDTFANCSELKALPEDLFRNCAAATTFYYCFADCTGLTEIPSNLFADCSSATNFGYCMYKDTAVYDLDFTNLNDVSTVSYFAYSGGDAENHVVRVTAGSTTESSFTSSGTAHVTVVSV